MPPYFFHFIIWVVFDIVLWGGMLQNKSLGSSAWWFLLTCRLMGIWSVSTTQQICLSADLSWSITHFGGADFVQGCFLPLKSHFHKSFVSELPACPWYRKWVKINWINEHFLQNGNCGAAHKTNLKYNRLIVWYYL